MTVALTLAGTLDFDPRSQKLTGSDGSEFALESPYGDELPAQAQWIKFEFGGLFEWLVSFISCRCLLAKGQCRVAVC